MKQKNYLLKLWMLLLCVVAGVGNAAAEDTSTIDFESETLAYTDWTFTGMTSEQTNSNVTAHGGSKFGTTGGKASASLVTKDKITSPKNIVFYVSKQTTNTTSSSWYVKVSSNGSTWEQVGEAQNATSMSRGSWVEVTRDLSSYSDVYVKIEYSGSTAVRCIDDVTLTFTSGGGDNQAVATTVTIDDSGITNTNVHEGTAAGTFSATVSTSAGTINGATVTWSSSNTSVATINENTGTVTLVDEGTTTITANYAGIEDEYEASSATYELTVTNTDPSLVTTYEKVTDALTLAEGDHVLIVYGGDNLAMGSIHSESKYYTGTNVTITDNKITLTNENVAVFTLGGNSTGWTFQSSLDDYYLSLPNNSNELRQSATATSNTEKWTISISNGDAAITNVNWNTRSIRYNSGSPRFACYTSGQQAVQIYRLAENLEETTITISPSEDFDLNFSQTKVLTVTASNGATVTAASSDETVATVAETGENEFTVTAVNGTTQGTTAMITFATEKTATHKAGRATINVTVKDARATLELSFSPNSVEVEKGKTVAAPTLNGNLGNGSVTYASSNINVATVDEGTGVVTGVAAGEATITATVAPTSEYFGNTATFTVTVTNPKHTATFSVNGTTTTQDFVEGATITFPENPADIEGKVFVGWVTTAITGITDTAPEFVTSATMGQNDVTFYAVFATTGGSGAALNKMQGGDTFAVGDQIVIVAVDGNASYALYQKTVNSSYVGYYEFDGQYSTVIADDKNWLTVSSSSTDNAWNLGDATNGYIYSSGSNNLSIDANNASSFTLDYVDNSGFTLKYGTRWLSFRNDVSTPNFRLGGTGATPLGIGYFDIYKIGSGSTYSAYCTTVVAETREEAGISFAEATVTKDITASYTGQALTNPHNVSPITWTSSNETVATVEDGTVTMVAPGETTITAAFAGNESYKPATVSYTLTVNDPTVATTLTINSDDITNTNVFTSTTAGSLSASVTTETGAPIDNASISWTSSNEQVATINQQGIVTLVAAGTTTITASYAGLQYTYGASTATYELNVVNTDPNAPGTEQNPYTVAQALANTPSNGNVYATGIVSKFVSGIAGVFSDNYHRYYISDDGTTQSGQLLVFNGKGLNNVDFTSNDDVQIGDIVTIYGDLVLYGSTKEFGAGNYIVSLKRAPVAPTFSPEGGTYTSVQSVEISCETKGSVIYYTTDGTEPTIESTPYTEAITVNADMTIKAIAVKDDLVSEVATAEYVIDFTPSIVFGNTDNSYSVSSDAGGTNVSYVASNISGDLTLVLCDADGNETTYDWFHAYISSNYYVRVDWDANTDTENARIGRFKLVAGNVESAIYTVTQAKYVADYATLPFEFDGGRNVISTTSGLTQEGLGSDYDSSPKLRFDGTGDYLILKISERPGILTFDIKGNSFSGGTFKVQTSEDGETYTDLKTYTSLSDTKSESFNNLGEDVRCIKWIYAAKQNGNVALGNIAIAKYEEQTPEPSITIVPATVEATAAKTEGTLTVTYADVDTDAEIVWYTDETATATTTSPSWILSEINSTTKNIDYTIQANNGGARTAYLKVYGLDAKGDDVYSNLVTISQEAPSAPAATTKWVLTDIDKLSDTDIFVIVGKTDDDYYAMSNDKGTGNAPEAVKVTVTDNTLSEPIGDNILWNISGNGTNGYTFYPNGESEKWLYCTNTNNGVRVGDNTGKTFKIENDYLKHVATSRYVGIYNDQDWRCYTNTTVNIADQTLGFYRKVEPVKFAASGYASYCSSSALDLTPTEDYAAWIVTEVTGTMVKFTKIVGAVPAGTPVILYGQNFGGQTALLPVAKGEPTAIGGNMLRGTLVDTYVDAVEGDYTNFGLSNGKFVRMNSGTVKAHKAFLPILTADLPSNNARMSIVFSDETTGIALNEKMETRNENQIYNLNGQRVETLKKGSLYIVNGKKFVSK